MSINKVDAFSVAYPESNDDNHTRYLTFCRIETKDGVTGWGEAIPMSGTGFPEACRATEQIIKGVEDLLLGRDPLDNMEIHNDLQKRMWWYGPEGIASFALSAIDIAIWDLKGKLLSTPIIKLIGGDLNKTFPVIAATHATLDDIKKEASRHGEIVRNGFKGVKVGLSERSGGLGIEVEKDVNFFRYLREECGDDAFLAIDRASRALVWNYTEAEERVKSFEELGIDWIEEPFEPWEVNNFTRLKQRTKTLIAAGEREWNTKAFRYLIDQKYVDVIGYDPAKSGGLTGFLDVIKLVEKEGLLINAHTWSSAINTAVSLAAYGTTKNTLVFELKPEVNPMQHEIVENPLWHKDGYIGIPNGPGLGIDIKENVLEKYKF